MVETIIGLLLALIFFGMPLAILWLFVASILDRRNVVTPKGRGEAQPADRDLSLKHAELRLEDAIPHRRALAAADRSHHSARSRPVPAARADHQNAPRRGDGDHRIGNKGVRPAQ
jgi:hypothetical protein